VPGNLFLTVGIPVSRPAEAVAAGLMMLPAVCAMEAIRAGMTSAERLTVKWVNDILLDDRKVGGVLTATISRAGLVESAVLGIGVNVAGAPQIEPTPFVPEAGSLAGSGVSVTLGELTWRTLERLAERSRQLMEEGPEALLSAYRKASCVVGRWVRVWPASADSAAAADSWPRPIAAGVATAVEEDLSLRIAGRAEPVTSGRLALEEACAGFGL
jgi:BirA family biotin operon repressor/biotin-[acetyl-CoA-carboxylase] ligase